MDSMEEMDFAESDTLHASCEANVETSARSLSISDGEAVNEIGTSTNPRSPPRMASPPRFVQCTHMTTTRIYNPHFRCSLCFKAGEFGFLYQCTQDLELLIEDELEKGNAATIDGLSKLLGPQLKATKGSPAARVHAESFFDEINEEQLKSYTPQQIDNILEHRRHANETAKQGGQVTGLGQGLQIGGMSSLSGSTISSPHGIVSHEKPWIPTAECQYKVCHHCRPGFGERSFLSLDAVANGDIPLTAATGFGFHFQGTRPVGLVKHVRNLGLRPNPTNTPSSKVFSNVSPHLTLSPMPVPPALSDSLANTSEPLAPFKDAGSADKTFGDTDAYHFTAVTRNLKDEIERSAVLSGPGIPFQEAFKMMERASVANEGTPLKAPSKSKEIPFVANSIKDTNKVVYSSSDVRPPWTPPGSSMLKPSEGDGQDIEAFDLSKGIYGRSFHNLDLAPAQYDGDVGLFLPLNTRLLDRAAAVPLPAPTPGELSFSTESALEVQHPTAMEVAALDGVSGREMLKVTRGLAVTEEAVKQHVPDVFMDA